VEFVIAGEGHQTTTANAERKEDLCCCICPDLRMVAFMIFNLKNDQTHFGFLELFEVGCNVILDSLDGAIKEEASN
jgi:hypothetical protein